MTASENIDTPHWEGVSFPGLDVGHWEHLDGSPATWVAPTDPDEGSPK